MRRNTIVTIAILALVVAGAVTATALVIIGGHRVPDRPEPVAWNRQACAYCRMMVGDPRYAAQLVTDDGDVLDFDDPGCLLAYLAEHHPRVHRMWFHDSTSDRWLAPDEVAFVGGASTPMDHGRAAVPRGTPGSTPFALDAGGGP